MDSVLAFYQKIDNPIQAAKELGTWLAQSQMMGPITAAQGMIVAFDALASGLPICEYPERYNVVCGRLTMKPEAMLADFNRMGGKHQIVQRSGDACEITFVLDGILETFAITWEEAKQESWPYKKDGKSLKETWAGPVGRADMLWARTVSRAIRKLKPEITAGKYTPEEIEDLVEYNDSIGGSNGKEAKVYDADELLKKQAAISLPAPPVASPVTATVTPAKPAVASPTNQAAKSVVKSAEVTETKPATSPAASPTTSPDGYATGEQTSRIRDLFTTLAVPTEAQEKALAKRGVSALRSLTTEQAGELITALESRLPPAPTEPERSNQSPDSMMANVEAACTQSQIDAVKQMVKEIAENDGDFVAKYRKRLAEFGKQKTADLSIREADVVIRQLTMDNQEAFFTKSLETLVAESQIEPSVEECPFATPVA